MASVPQPFRWQSNASSGELRVQAGRYDRDSFREKIQHFELGPEFSNRKCSLQSSGHELSKAQLHLATVFGTNSSQHTIFNVCPPPPPDYITEKMSLDVTENLE